MTQIRLIQVDKGRIDPWPPLYFSHFINFKKTTSNTIMTKQAHTAVQGLQPVVNCTKNCCYVTWTLRFISVAWLFLDKQICLKKIKKELEEKERKHIFCRQLAGSSAVKTELSSNFIWLSVFLKNFTAGIKVEEQTVILILKLLILWLFCSCEVD